MHIDNKTNYILVLDKGPTQGLNDTKITAETKYSFNFTESGERFVISLHYNVSNRLLSFNAAKTYQLKGSEVKPYPLCLGNITKDFSVANMKK